MVKVPKDPNAKLALDRLCEINYGSTWANASDKRKDELRNYITQTNQIKAFMEQSEARVCEQNGTFVCEANYAFLNIIDQCEHYRIYRCEGGHHYAVVFIEHKEREGSTGNERRIVYRNGQMVMEEGQSRNEDQLELD